MLHALSCLAWVQFLYGGGGEADATGASATLRPTMPTSSNPRTGDVSLHRINPTVSGGATRV